MLDVCKMFGHVEYKGFDTKGKGASAQRGGMALVAKLGRDVLLGVLERVGDKNLVISARYSATDHMLSGPVKSLDLALRSLDNGAYGAYYQKLVSALALPYLASTIRPLD